jgi:hypothetical protein
VRSRGTAIDRLSGRVFVFVDEAAEQVGALELRIGWRSEQSRASIRLLRWTKCKSPMRPMPVVMAGVDAEHVFELAAAEDEESIETVVPDRQYPALGVRVRVRAWTGVRITAIPSLWKTWSKPPLNLASRSWMRKRNGCSLSSIAISRLRACWATQAPVGLRRRSGVGTSNPVSFALSPWPTIPWGVTRTRASVFP